MIIVNISQAFSYNLMKSHYAKEYEKIRIINGKDLTLEAALAKLSYLLGKVIIFKLFI